MQEGGKGKIQDDKRMRARKKKSLTIHLLFHSIEARAYCHWLEVARPIDSRKVAAWFSQSLVESPLQLLLTIHRFL